MESGILDRTRLVANVLMLILLIGNIYFSIQYVQGVRIQEMQRIAIEDKMDTRLEAAKLLKLFVDVVLNTDEVASYASRVKLESDLLQMNDPALTSRWESFVASGQEPEVAQEHAVKLMSLIIAKML